MHTTKPKTDSRYYKVVSLVHGVRGSVIMDPTSIAYTKYSKLKFTKAPHICRKQGYHITVFETLESAKLFIYEFGCYDNRKNELWEVKCIGIRSKMPSHCMESFLSNNNQFQPTSSTWANGTIMARKVKLVKRIMKIPTWFDARNIFSEKKKKIKVIIHGKVKRTDTKVHRR